MDYYKPSRTHMSQLVKRWIELQEKIDVEQIKYRQFQSPYDWQPTPPSLKDTVNWPLLQKNVDPLWTEQKNLFVTSPFEEMVWDYWVKPYVVDEGGTDWLYCTDLPDWVWKVWSEFE